ncbi:hypothetical protein VA7868_04488 [Vibrio aerogenes CECT 7868]|uniref:Tc1-like transposase DDE domain-containing protein n=1 Tax=Vibrio aerogenes CECT 7868 TaxID=1216006 RepID=A0A1M6ENC0_9VIBR|nr:hypothetical protein VA7868_04488 [Vibrio aerogenes CECT 7868]
MGFSWITSRSRHPKQSGSAQKDFKKIKIETILKIRGHISLKQVDIWFQDEARFGQQNTTTRLWAQKGSRPRAIRQQQFEYTHIFRAVCPGRGIGEAIVVPYIGKDVVRQHLQQFSLISEPSFSQHDFRELRRHRR